MPRTESQSLDKRRPGRKMTPMVKTDLALVDNFRANVLATLRHLDCSQADLARAMNESTSLLCQYMKTNKPGLGVVQRFADGLSALGWNGSAADLFHDPDEFSRNL